MARRGMEELAEVKRRIASLPDVVGREHAAIMAEVSMLLRLASQPGSPALSARFESLCELLVGHFRTEEGLLEWGEAASRTAHKREHDRLLALVREVRGRMAPWMEPQLRMAAIDSVVGAIAAHFEREATEVAVAAIAVDAAPALRWA